MLPGDTVSVRLVVVLDQLQCLLDDDLTDDSVVGLAIASRCHTMMMASCVSGGGCLLCIQAQLI